MSELIRLNDVVTSDKVFTVYNDETEEYYEVIKIQDLYDIPTVIEKHGHWIKTEGWNTIVCSVCLHYIPAIEITPCSGGKTRFINIPETDYCPYCGARMDGKAK